MGTLGAGGPYPPGLMPSMTLGSGGIGGRSPGDNITVHHMFNIKRLAYELTRPPEAALAAGARLPIWDHSAREIEAVVQSVIQEILAQQK